ncbi:MAG: hypothetical protein ACE5FD_12835, partial [Anaerolineae bacterium]
LVHWQILPWFNGMRWLRVHLITLGVVTEVIFGSLPGLVTMWHGRTRPAFRWDIWFLLNGGILTLLIGIPIVSPAPIIGGGLLVFTATLLLIIQLVQMRPAVSTKKTAAISRWFYLAGLAYFLLGIFIGAGLWFGWNESLLMKVPIEVHIHANNWGLMSLVFAGLVIDFYPVVMKRPLASPKSLPVIFWMMNLGAVGLIIGPWTGSLLATVPGLLLHLTATIWLLVNMIKPIRSERAAWTPGMWHLISSYVWLLAPVLTAPFVVFKIADFDSIGVEQNAPQALIYGWVLQFAFAIVPLLFRRVFQPGEPARWGGNWFSLAAVHVGGALLWVGIFVLPARAVLHGFAYALWAVAVAPIVMEMWGSARVGLVKLEEHTAVAD